jgi:hypothetical protein
MRAASTRRLSLTIASMVVAGCGGTAVVANTSGMGYATTPTSSGPLNPHAIPLGDGYVSTSPKVGYVDSCQTRFGGIGVLKDGVMLFNALDEGPGDARRLCA